MLSFFFNPLLPIYFFLQFGETPRVPGAHGIKSILIQNTVSRSVKYSISVYTYEVCAEVYSSLFYFRLSKITFLSRQNIASVDDNIASSHVSRSITGKIEIEALYFLRVALSPHGRHAVSLIDAQRASAHLSIEEARRDNINPSEFAPLTGKRLSKVSDICLCGIVDWLVGGDIHDVATHTRSNDEVSKALAVEDLAGILGAIHNAVNLNGLVGSSTMFNWS